MRTVLCCIVYDSCDLYTHTDKQFVKLTFGLGFSLDLGLLLVFFCHFVLVLFAFVV